jgi:hypothetical protein
VCLMKHNIAEKMERNRDNVYTACTTFRELFTLPHLSLPDSYWIPGFLLDWTRTLTNLYLSPSKFLLELQGIADS